MGRTKQQQSSSDIEADIRRLQTEKERAIVAEDQRRGALVREYLAGGNGDALRAALAAVASRRDAHLFGLDSGTDTTVSA